MDTDGNSVTTDGTLATRGITSNGIKGTITGAYNAWSTAANIVDTTYGDTGETFTPGADSTGAIIDTFNTSADVVEITVINESGSSLTIDAIAFDAQANFGTGNLTVSHLSGSSELADDSTDRNLGTVALSDTSLVEQSIVTTGMTDFELAVGETAAFRIQATGSFMSVKLDNIAVMTSTELEEPPFDDNAVVLAAWADFTATASDLVATFPVGHAREGEINFAPLRNQAPSYTTVGVTANLGKDVNPAVSAQGGGSMVDANDGTDGSYGSAYSISAANRDTDNPSALELNNWGNAKNQYIDFSITNTTGSDLRLTGIHFDAQTIFSNNRVVDDNDTPDDTSDDVVTSVGTPNSVTVAHFDAVSDLIDDVTQRTLGTGTSTMNYVPKGNGISLAAMADTILAEGETAAFRLKITNADGAKGHMRIDNLAITGIPAGTLRTLTVDTSAVEAGAGGVDLNGSRKYVDGETVSITATAAEGYTFTGWSGASNSTDATISVTLSADTTLTPNFAAALTELPTLSISSDGTNVTLTWEGTATLKRADSLSGGTADWSGTDALTAPVCLRLDARIQAQSLFVHTRGSEGPAWIWVDSGRA